MQKPKQPPEQQELQSKLDAIADDFLMRCREGKKPKVKEYVEKHPELAEEVTELLQTLKFVEKFREDSSVGSYSAYQQPDEIVLGSRIGNYEVLEQIGVGGMGVVFKAIHHKLKRPVALKVLSATQLTEEQLARFEREMSVSGQLDSPNIVATHDGGNADGFHFIAMELVEGSDLGKIATANAPLSVGSASELIRQAALGLQQAHEIGLVHRDIKPSNLMLSNDGVVKILDLGLAKLHSEFDQHELTQSQQIMGTIDYIASEQCKDSRSVDIRSDIYSLGATFCKLLTGEAPYSGPSMSTTFEKLTALATVDPESIANKRNDLSIEIVNIVNKMTRKDPNDRFQLPCEIVEALAPFADRTEFPSLLEKASKVKDETPTGKIRVANRETSRAKFAATMPGSQWQSIPNPYKTIDFVDPKSNPDLLERRKNPTSKKRTKLLYKLVALGLLIATGLGLAFNSPQIIRIVTNKGVLVIENGEGVEVTVKRGDVDSIVVLDNVTDREYSLEAGDDYQLIIKETESGTTFRSKNFSIARNQETVLDAKLEIIGQSEELETLARSKDIDPKELPMRQRLDWLFNNGMRHIRGLAQNGGWFSCTSAHTTPLDLKSGSQLHIEFDLFDSDGTRIEDLLNATDDFDLRTVAIWHQAPSASALKALAARKSVISCRFFGKFDFEALAKVPKGHFRHVIHLLLHDRITSENLRLIDEHFPNLERLNCHKIDFALEELNQLDISDLCLQPIGSAMPQQLEKLKNVSRLNVVCDASLTSEPELDMSRLPPGIETLGVFEISPTAEHLEQFGKYENLKSVSYFINQMPRQLLELKSDTLRKFQKAHPKISIIVDDKRHSDLASRPIAGIVSPGAKAIRSILDSGAKSVNLYRRGVFDRFVQPLEVPSDLYELGQVWIDVEITDPNHSGIERILDLADELPLDRFQTFGEAPLAKDLKLIGERKGILHIMFHDKFDFDELAKIPDGLFEDANRLAFHSSIDTERLHIIGEKFPTILEDLICTNLIGNTDVVNELQIESLGLAILPGESLPSLTNVDNIKSMTIAFFDGEISEPIDFSQLPPSIERLSISEPALTAEHFEQLEQYDNLKSVDIRFSGGTRRQPLVLATKAIDRFRKTRPQVQLTVDDPLIKKRAEKLTLETRTAIDGSEWANRNSERLVIVKQTGVSSVTAKGTHPDYLHAKNLVTGVGLSEKLDSVESIDTVTHDYAINGNAWVTDCFDSHGKLEPDYFASKKRTIYPTLNFSFAQPLTIEGFVYWGYMHSGPTGGHCNEPRTFEFTFLDAGGDEIGESFVTSVRAPAKLNARIIELPPTERVAFVQVRILDNFFGDSGGDRVGMSEVRFLAKKK